MSVSIPYLSEKISKGPVVRLAFLLYVLTFCLFSFSAFAQNRPVIRAVPDTTQIRIGEQIRVELNASIPPGSRIEFPVPADTLNSLEIVRRTQVDTIREKDPGDQQFKQELYITAFDSGYYVLEPLHFLYHANPATGPETLSTEAFLFRVNTIEVDTTAEIKDVKAILDPGIDWKEIAMYAMIGFLSLGFILLIITYFIRRKKKTVQAPVQVPKIPSHQKALEALDAIEAKKLWQQGMYKEYHSQVADTVRTYIEERFGIPAMELPTDDTLQRFRGISMPYDAMEKLDYLLRLADMVKFAKTIPVGGENEKAILDARTFINLTRPVQREDINKEEAKP